MLVSHLPSHSFRVDKNEFGFGFESWNHLQISLSFFSSTGTSSAPPSAGVGPPPPQAALLGGDRYAALAELDNVFSSSAPNVSGYNTSTTSQGWELEGRIDVIEMMFLLFCLKYIQAFTLPFLCVIQACVWILYSCSSCSSTTGCSQHASGFCR